MHAQSSNRLLLNRPIGPALLCGVQALALLAWCAEPARAQISSGFDSDPEGWTVVEFPGPPYDVIVDGPTVPSWDLATGNPGGTIWKTDEDGTLFLFSAPPAFLGDQTSKLGGCLTFDLRFPDNGLSPGSQHPDAVLWGTNGDVLLIDAFQDPLTQTGVWESYSIGLGSTDGWRKDDLGGPLATAQELEDVLSDLAGLFVRGDLWAGAETTFLDNPTLSGADLCSGLEYCQCSDPGVCGNGDPTAGCRNSTGSGSRLRVTGGSVGVSADDLVLTATSVPPSQSGILFMGGGTSTGIPFGDGLLCVLAGASSICRFPVQNAGPGGTLSEGPGIVAFSQTQAAACHIGPGATWNFQAWYRDPSGPCGGAFNLTNGLSLTFAP